MSSIVTFAISKKHLLKALFQNSLPILLQLMYSVVSAFVYLIVSWLFFGEGANSFLYTKTNGFICIAVAFVLPMIYNLRKLYTKSKNEKTKYKIALIFNFISTILFYFFCT